jgi:hypothetical protein
VHHTAGSTHTLQALARMGACGRDPRSSVTEWSRGTRPPPQRGRSVTSNAPPHGS